jgi:hypothetical protein
MQTSNTNQTISSNDPVWYFLAEYSLSKFLDEPDACDEGGAGMLSQTIQDPGMPAECIHYMEETLRSFAREALARFQQGRMELPRRIRIFCQKKMVDDTCSEKSSSLHNIEPAIGQERNVRYSRLKMTGGWGYFFIIRGENFQDGSSVNSSKRIDLYIYKEGE